MAFLPWVASGQNVILQAVPQEDYEDEEDAIEAEDVTLYGRSAAPAKGSATKAVAAKDAASGSPVAPGRGKGKVAALKAKVKQATGRVRGADAEEGEGSGFVLAVLAGCLCLGVLAIGTLLALLKRYGDEANRAAAAAREPVVVAFGYGLSTDTALAWLLAAVLNGELRNASTGEASPFAPPPGVQLHLAAAGAGAAPRLVPFLPDRRLVRVWRPPAGVTEAARLARLRAYVHGDSVKMLRRVYQLGPPRLTDLNGKGGAVVPEADALLSLRAAIAEDDEEPSDGAGGGAGGGRRLERSHRMPVVLVSHPHHLPYLMVLARASGFEVLSLPANAYDAVPWADFGCGPLGYAPGAQPEAQLAREAAKLRGLAEALSQEDADRWRLVAPLVEAANATLQFHRCMAQQLASYGELVGHSGHELTASVAAAPPNSTVVQGAVAACSGPQPPRLLQGWPG